MNKHADFGRIADNVYYFAGFEDDIGAGFILTEKGIVVIDTTMLPTSAKTFLGIIEALYPDKQISAIINAHIHRDHHFGNETFIKRFPKAEIIAHEKFLQTLKGWAAQSGEDISKSFPKRLMQKADARTVYYRPYLQMINVILPSKTIPSDTTLKFGSTTIQLLHTPGHTEDLVTVYLPKEKILFASDSIYPTKTMPVLFMGHPDDWIRSLRKLLNLDIKVLLPGHGLIPENPHDEIKRHIEKLTYVKNGVIETLKKSERSMTFSQIEKNVDFLKGRDLLAVLRSLVKRGIVEADSEDVENASLKLRE
jgi:glyoxylase-like metal-dependent hydrolase (beta-lactamase superfamily II)